MPWEEIDGDWVLKQSEEASCGICCVGMAINLIEGSRIPEEALVVAFKRISNRYDRSTKDRRGFRPTPIVQMGYDVAHHGAGTYGENLAGLLHEYSINATYVGIGGNLVAPKTAMRHVGTHKFVIALVQWVGGGGHWVLVVDRDTHFGRASDYKVLDPAGYVVENKGSSNYYPPYDAAGGSFCEYHVKVEGRMRYARASVLGKRLVA